MGAEAKAAVLAGLRAGMRREEAAERAGYCLNAFYCARRRDPVFALAWDWALQLSAVEEKARLDAEAERAALAEDGEILPGNRRRLQRRRVRQLRFTDTRKRIFLDHFAGTGDAFAAAAAAGVCYATVFAHRARDPEFAAAWDEALAQAYAMLEVEAVRQRLEAQRKLREGGCPTGEVAQEFERVMKLLARYERRCGRIGMRQVRAGRERRWTFDEAIGALDKSLQAFGVRRGLLPPPATGDSHFPHGGAGFSGAAGESDCPFSGDGA
jgi:hypothetical protein